MSSKNVQPKWDIYEAVILLDGYLEMMKEHQPRQRIIRRISAELREMAVNRGLEIDDIYRNMNGISFQMSSMESAYVGRTIRKPATSLFEEVVSLFRSNRIEYNNILKGAKSMTGRENECFSKANSQSTPANEERVEKVDFCKETNLSYTLPLKVRYFDKDLHINATWTDAYVKLMAALYNDFADDIPVGRSFTGNGHVDFGNREQSKSMTEPKRVFMEMYLETKISATSIVHKIKALLDICHVAYENVDIEYKYKSSIAPPVTKPHQQITTGNCTLSITTESGRPQPKDFDKLKFEETLLRRYRNGMQFDSIDFDNFRETYNMLYGVELPFDDAALEERLRYCGVIYRNRVFPAEGIINKDAKEKLFSYIDNSFASGKKVLYYKAIFEDLTDVFSNCFTLSDEAMLKAYIEYSAEGDKYFFFQNYMSTEKNITIDHNAEVSEVLLNAGKPMMVEDVCTALSHIPQKQVQDIITTDIRFLRNAKSEYFHSSIFEVSDEELNYIRKIIDDFIDENGYAIWGDVWNEIQDKMPIFLENNLYLSCLGIRNVIAQYYIGTFTFEGSVISLPKDRLTMRDVYQLYAKHHDKFTADDIYNFSKELNTVINFDALAEVSVRISHDLFISKKQISFDADAVDSAIESFMAKDYIRIRDIDSFLAFPNVGYEWNEYLLESFVTSYSKNYVLLNNGRALNNVAGSIVKRESRIKEFVDICAEELANSGISLNKTEALDYLATVKLITRRSYKDLDSAVRKAMQIRERKE